ncbi:PDZ domain-containing protein [Roseiconus nitratireducens]|uniref:PDZ domain-containing protein n=2 Tax=Roseiconus nitratireducens TaxID=2605748 RepID=A0A5M6CW91_9BACT|nr:PDZ domain-containing protein [Roseiconus nitratireducens]
MAGGQEPRENQFLQDRGPFSSQAGADVGDAFEIIETAEESRIEGLSEADRGRGRKSASGTRVAVPESLQRLLKRGGVPTSLQQLQELEQQQQRVARIASACTVSVRIGPAQGCGVIITDTGFIVTAAHVAMRPGKTAFVTLSNGRQVTATTLGMNRRVDAGLIRINPGQNAGEPWPHASLGSSEDLVPGMWCIALGHPGGYDSRRGSVIRVGRLLEVRPDVIKTDCALIGGDSGGPLFNIAGELIAVHSRIGNDVADNLHVPIDHYDYAWDRMAAGKSWGFLPNFKPTLGVTGNQSDEVARIIDVKEGSPAEQGGLLPEDVVEQFGEKMISDFNALKDAVADTMPGERVPIWVKRGATRVRVIVEIGRDG